MRIICKLQDVAGGLRIEDRIEVSGALAQENEISLKY